MKEKINSFVKKIKSEIVNYGINSCGVTKENWIKGKKKVKLALKKIECYLFYSETFCYSKEVKLVTTQYKNLSSLIKQIL